MIDSATPQWPDSHSHEPNPVVPEGDERVKLVIGGTGRMLDLADLRAIKYTELSDVAIASSGHPSTGPFRFGGALVSDLLAALMPGATEVDHVDFVSADGYGTRLDGALLRAFPGPLIAYAIDGAPMRREQGLVRLIVPAEIDAALHQVKWLARIEVFPGEPT